MHFSVIPALFRRTSGNLLMCDPSLPGAKNYTRKKTYLQERNMWSCSRKLQDGLWAEPSPIIQNALAATSGFVPGRVKSTESRKESL